MKEDFYLSSLMVSKLCHDLIGSSSTLTFSLEEVLKEGDNNSEAVNLALKSAQIFINRLKYFRAAFGISSVSKEGTLTNTIRSLILDLYKEKDIHIVWVEKFDTLLDSYFNNINVKLFLNIFLLVFYNIPKSATITVDIVKLPQGNVGIMLTVKGYKVALKDNVLNILNSKAPLEEISPRNIHLYFTAFLKQEVGSRIEISNNDNNQGLKLAFSLPEA